MNEERRLVFSGAHPDDETFGIGATLAQYAAAGVKVYYACATRGEAGSADPEFLRGYTTSGDMRWVELECAAKTLGLGGVFYLGYRDSGMGGGKDNEHPEALARAPLEEVTRRIVKVLREVRPQVVITFDPGGGYQHPDHIAMHLATVQAFRAAADPTKYPEAGPPCQPQKLYCHVSPRRRLERLILKLLPPFGQDPRHLGRNKDIDVTRTSAGKFPVHAAIRLTKAARAIQKEAVACHASQLKGRWRRSGLMGFISWLYGHRHDYYMRVYPPANGRRREKDLFAGMD